MKSTLFPVTLVLFGAVTAAQAQMPTRKAGLWETTMSGTSSLAAEGGGKVKQCIDAATDRAAMSGVMAAKACQQSGVVKTATGYELEATCKFGEMTSKSKSVITGDFNSKVTIQVTSLISTGGGPAKESKTILESRFIGPCEAGQKPGDIIMPDGKVIKTPSVQ